MNEIHQNFPFVTNVGVFATKHVHAHPSFWIVTERTAATSSQTLQIQISRAFGAIGCGVRNSVVIKVERFDL